MIFKAEVYDGPVGSTGFASITTATTSSWLDITSAAPNADLSWRTGFNAGVLTIQTATAYSPYKDYAVRITYTSKYSEKPESDRTKIEEFIVRLTPSDTCIWDTLTKTNEIPD